MSYHNPVLLHPTVDGLDIKPEGVYVDVTFGGGGHAKEILRRLSTTGKLIAFDQDVGISIFFAFSSAFMWIGVSRSKVHLFK